MATFNSDIVTAGNQPRAGLDITAVKATYTVSANLTAADIIQMVTVPAGATILSVRAGVSASIGATATASIGDGSDADRFIAAATFGQGAVGVLYIPVSTGIGYTYTAEDTIDITIATMATPATGAVITMTVIYTMQS